MDRPQTAPAKKTSAIASGPTVESTDFSGNSDSLEHCLAEVPKEQPDELWPTPLWPGHFCKRSLLQLRDSSGLATQQPPYCFAVRYDIRPLVKQLSEKSAYLMLLDGEKLRRIGRGSGVDIIAASKSWIAWGALCAQPLLLTRDAQGKLVGEAQVQPELDCHANGEGVLLMTVVLTPDIKNRQLWQTAGDLMSYRLGSPQVLCGLCSVAVPMRELSAHQSHQCQMVLSACPRCKKEVPIRELAAHQVGPDCLGSSSMGTQTLEKKVQDAPSQCSAPVLLPAGVQTGYALYAPENLRSEEPVPALVPSAAVRWSRPAPEARPGEYQLSIFEFRGGDAREQWSRLRVELLEMSSLEKQGLRGELRHELTHLRPGTQYRLELQPRAPDGSLGPAAAVVLTTLSRLAGFEGFSAEDKATLEAVPQPVRAARPESISLREQSTQAGLGFVQGACKSEISREIGVQAFPTVLEEAACQVDPIIPVTQEIACGEEWASYTSTGMQCKAPTAETSVQSALQVGHSSCQAQFPPRPITGDRMAELEMDMQAALPGPRAVLHQVGTAELMRLSLAVLANLLALASILLAEISLEELWPMLSVLLLVIPLNGLEFAFFEMFLPSRRAASKLRVWRRRNANLNRLIQLAALAVSDALRLYRAALQPGGPRFTGVLEPSQRGKTDQVQVAVLPSGDKTASAKSVSQAASSPDKWRSWLTPDELCGARCPVCSCTTPLPRMADLWRSTRFGLYCNVPQLAIALMLLLRQLQSSDTWGVATSLHVCALSAHGLGLLWILLRWVQLGCRRRAKHTKVAELTSDSIEKTLQLQWRGIEDVICDAWFVVFYSFDKKNVLRVEMLPGRPSQGQWAEKNCLQLHDAPAGHFWVSVLCWHRGSLTMPLAMGHCDIPAVEAEPGPSRKRADVAEIGTDAKPWEVVDAGTDPKDVIRPVAHAEVQNVPASVDAASQFPAVPVELCDASTTPELASASERRVAKVGTSLGSFDLPVQLQCQEIASSEAGSKGATGLWLTWLPHGLVEAAPRLVVHARRITATAGGDEPGEPGARVPAAMSLNQASFEHLEEGRFELLLSCELGACSAEVRRCPHDRCGRHVWADNLEDHIRHCPWRPRECPRAPVCSWRGCEDELQEHLHDCPGREIPCRHCGLGCWWAGPGKDEERHLEEDCEPQRLLRIVRPLNELLSEACPDFRNPEVLRLQAKAVAYRRSVSAPGAPWREWKTPGRCFSCRKPVDRREQGLQSDSGEHRLCWSCLPKHVDWQHFRDNA